MYIYHENGRIRLVSSSRLSVCGLEEFEVAGDFDSPQNLVRNFRVRNNQLVPKRKSISGERLKIAMVGVWDIPCGIATYTSFLVDELRKTNNEVQVFAEHNDTDKEGAGVVRCWKRGESLKELSRRLKDYDPDVIYIQHEYGIFPDAREWTKFISSIQDFNYHVVLHSVYYHKDKTVCEAICKNIIVHTDIAKK